MGKFKFLRKFKFWPVVIIIFFATLASRTLLFERGYFNMHDDLQMMRQLELEKCFKDFQIPCRWVQDMGYGYGFPLFNFYPPGPYLVGEIFRVFGFSFVETAKLTFALSIFLSGITMYFLAKEFFGNKGGLLASIFYIWAPYHSVDIYVRGAMNEAWALVFFPLILLFSHKLIKRSKGIIPLALSLTGLLLSHNLMVIIFAPVVFFWCLMFRPKVKDMLNIAYSGALALGLSAFFTLPAIFENKFTWLRSQLTGYYDYTAHFATIRQLLISRFWGYGPSVWLDVDGMSFQVGWVWWILSLVIIGTVIYLFVKKKKVYYVPVFLFFVGWFATFMAHQRSIFIYHILTFLDLVQFPWRFLTISIFGFSFLAGSVVLFVNKKYVLWVIVPLILMVTAYSWNYFLPEHGHMGPLTDQEKFSGLAWDKLQTSGIYDYLPITAKEAPKQPRGVAIEFMSGGGSISNIVEKTDRSSFHLEVTKADSEVRINTLEFPGWKVWLDGTEIKPYIPDTEMWGRMWIKVPKGTHDVQIKFTNTPIRTASNIISLVSWLGLAGVIKFGSGKSRRPLRSNSRNWA